MDKERIVFLEKIFALWGFVLILWAIYRRFFELAEWADEFIFKPLIFLGPVLLFVFVKEKKSLASIGVAWGKFVRDLYIGLAFGVLFALEGIATNALKHGTISLAPVVPIATPILLLTLVYSLAAAFTEEVLVRGFLFTRLRDAYQSQFKALIVSTIMYFVILIPVIFTRLSLSPTTLAIFLMTNLIMSFANTMIFSETKTVTVPVLIHTFWNMAVVLYL